MESNINYNPTIMRDISGKVIETKRQNPAKQVIKKLLRVDLMDSIKEMDSNKEAKSVTTSPTLAEVKAKMASGQKLTNEETQVLVDHIKKTEAEYAARRKSRVPKGFVSPKIGDPDYFKSQKHKPSELAKTELPQKLYSTAGDRNLQQQENIRRIENAARKPLDYKVKSGFERAKEKIGELAEAKVKQAERIKKIITKFDKLSKYAEDLGLKDIMKIFKK